MWSVMPVAIDTSVLVEAEKRGSVDALLPREEDGPFYIPALAAVEFLVGTHAPVKNDLRYRALLIYQEEFKQMVADFTEADAVQMAGLFAELRRKGQTMKFFDVGIAASVIARGDKLLTTDGDFDRLEKKLSLLRL
jgi:predicted nucleic acid-binding protein